MNKILVIALVGLFLMNCTSNTIIKKPDNLISKDEMVDLLTDLLLAQGAQNVRNLDMNRKVDYYHLVFEKYNIDSAQFRASNYYYTSDIDEYDKIIRKVEERLVLKIAEFDKTRKEKDSLERMKQLKKDKPTIE